MSQRDVALEQALDQLIEEQQDERPSDDIVALLTLARTQQIAHAVGCNTKQVEMAALERHVLPTRYHRNLGTVGWAGQIALLKSTVAVVGAGGLGGWVIEGLARMGVGRLIIIDGDSFEENNLNRQIGCTEQTLGKRKAHSLRDRVVAVNSAVEVVARVQWLDADNAQILLRGADVIVDALDTLPSRLILSAAARALRAPLVHGAIGGYTGQVMTILPGDPGLEALYGDRPRPERGVEAVLGNPSATPMMISAWQIQEVVKQLTGQGELLRNRLLLLDALYGQITEMHLG